MVSFQSPEPVDAVTVVTTVSSYLDWSNQLQKKGIGQILSIPSIFLRVAIKFEPEAQTF